MRSSIGVRSLCLAFRRLASQAREYTAPDERENEKRDYHSQDLDEMGLQPIQNLFNFIAEKKGQPCPEIIPNGSRDHYYSGETSRRIVQRARRRHENLEGHRRGEQSGNDQSEDSP